MPGISKAVPKWFARVLYYVESGVMGFAVADTAIRLSRGKCVNLVLILIAIVPTIHLSYLMWRDLRAWRVNMWTRKAIELKKHGSCPNAVVPSSRESVRSGGCATCLEAHRETLATSSGAGRHWWSGVLWSARLLGAGSPLRQ